MLRRLGPAGILLHHVSRSGNDYRGTSAIGAAIELGFRLARHPGDPEARERRSLRCFKCRPAPEPEEKWLRLHIERDQVFIDPAEPFAEAGEQPPAPKRAELAPQLLAAAKEPTTWPDLARALDRSPKDGPCAAFARTCLSQARSFMASNLVRLMQPGGYRPTGSPRLMVPGSRTAPKTPNGSGSSEGTSER